MKDKRFIYEINRIKYVLNRDENEEKYEISFEESI